MDGMGILNGGGLEGYNCIDRGQHCSSLLASWEQFFPFQGTFTVKNKRQSGYTVKFIYYTTTSALYVQVCNQSKVLGNTKSTALD